MKSELENDDRMDYRTSLIASIKDIARISSDQDFLGNLRSLLADPGLNLTKLADDIDDQLIGELYCLLVLINDIWANLAIDASFSFPSDHPKFICLVNELRQFISASLRGEKDNKEAIAEAYVSYCRAVKEFCLLLQDLECRFKQGKAKLGGE